MNPPELARGDRWAARYLVAVLDRDTEAMRITLNEVDEAGAAWDVLDAVAALVRDALIECHDSGKVRDLLRSQLLAAALGSEGEL